VDAKRIRSRADLAINGAAPAFDEPVHVGRPNLGDRHSFLQRVGALLDSRHFTNDGPLVRELELRVAQYLGVRHCVAMCNGTIALEIAIRALGLTGEVIVPSYTFVATAHALQWQEIRPVFADIDPATHVLDSESVRRCITPKTSAIIGVHLWGRAAPHDELQSIAAEHGLALIYDAAHAFGCTYRGTMIGNFGACEVLSFHATKSFHSFEGGAIVTNDDDLARKARLARNFGFSGYDNVVTIGTNGKMTEICAAMGLTNLERFSEVVETNRARYEDYCAALAHIPDVSVLHYDERERANYHYVVVELNGSAAAKRDAVVDALHAENILARRYFWPGCHAMMPYRELYPDAARSLPNTIEVAARTIVLPTGAPLPPNTIEVVADVLQTVLAPR
jgi:dTDP-4-amino-4,6-dideoxygalactose transaminase